MLYIIALVTEASGGRQQMVIPWTQLSEDALLGVLEDFVSREGTEYGAREFTLEEKVTEVKRQLERGEAVIVFDPESESCSVVAATEIAPRNQTS